MSCDKLIFDLSQEVEGSPSVFVKKDWLNILDNQNANYNSNQSVIDTSQLSNSNKYMSYREAYLSVPLLLTMTSVDPLAANQDAFLPDTAPGSAAYACGLKNWFGTMIHSLTLDYNGVTTIQQTPFCNMWNSFRLMTSMSWGDVHSQGDTIGFYPDNALSTTFNQGGAIVAECDDGAGTSNNTNKPTDGGRPVVAGFDAHYQRGRGNDGFIKRQMGINYDLEGLVSSSVRNAVVGVPVPYSGLLAGNACNQLWKTYISNKVNGAVAGAGTRGAVQWSIVSTIYLKDLHSFFSSIPLLKGAYMKATLNLNNCTTTYSVASAVVAVPPAPATGPTYVAAGMSVANAVGGVNPVMLASTSTANGASLCYPEPAAGAANIAMKVNVSVGATCLENTMLSTSVAAGELSRSIYLYVPSYTFNPVYEQAYLSSPVKQIKYTDIYQYQVTGIAGNSGLVNNLITNGIANIKSILVLPFYSATNSASTQLPSGMPVYQSPFDPAGTGPTSPLALMTNFNVVVSGQNSIYNTQRYAFEQFNNQLYGTNAVNGGQTLGITSGLVDRLAFDTAYCYYYVDLSRMLPVEESVPKSIQIIGTNTNEKVMDYFVFVEYGVEISIDALTGVRV
tara:strand:- start:2418 stop:4271 length:1854 start_codon:yes stop_codon:yes gene_type:complete